MSSYLLDRTYSILDDQPPPDFNRTLASMVKSEEDFQQMSQMMDSQIILSTL
eukprot:CAMPEP_0170550498 /NCGR_PEP_ID=MMETSP0211-20121228/8558_1 /TAXON_ID=311385 /ORGANISM="Pseudokeronopsis sp., Strain OXSARD2" /LENGTH=51 /DNA_ID=CAMNT_0010857083 /DNA_START=117 /DNA_END=269 /DNA_ORIENTATION=-